MPENYLNFDETTSFIIGGFNGNVKGLLFDIVEFRQWIEEIFDPIISVIEDETMSPAPAYRFDIIFKIHPLGNEMQGFVPLHNNIIILEDATPRFVFRFVREFARRFPENQEFYVIVFGLLYGYVDPTLPEEEGLRVMMNGSEELLQRLGVGTIYDWGQ